LQAAWPPANRQADEQLATFAGGCFWSVELAFQVRANALQRFDVACPLAAAAVSARLMMF